MNTIKQISDRVFMLASLNAGSNVYLINDEKPVLIDTSLSLNSVKLNELLSKANLSKQDIAFVLHTHGHADHWGNSFEFSAQQNFMHKLDAELVNSERDDFAYASLYHLKNWPKIGNKFEGEQILNLGETKLHVLLTPGHTAGSVSFYLPELKFLFSGDTVFSEAAVGRTDVLSGNFDSLKESVLKLSKLEIEALFPGHWKELVSLKANQENFRQIFSNLNLGSGR
ncbi:MAG: MBL fold metallo-hydrolase [Candidatus Diapherotrites archaeon]|nr:MBL fold metallo-hydrolase [Candidatus Diapherotrites archaeon]